MEAFTRQVERKRSRFRYQDEPTPANPGHNPAQVPPVPVAIVDNRPSYTGEASSIFTWKAETGQPPYLIYHVTGRWLTHVVRPGFAVLSAYPVLDIIETSDDGLPSLIKAVELSGYFDSGMHGWRAWGNDITCAVAWDGDEPFVEPLDAAGHPRSVRLFGTL